MLGIDFKLPPNAAPTILCLGAHSDDIEIGCGGTLLRLLAEYPQANVHWIVLGTSGHRQAEALASARDFLGALERQTIQVQNFRDGFFPYEGGALKEYFEQLKRAVAPDLIFTHYRHDLHQDHRQLCELTWNTFRNHLILEYEIPKYDGDLGAPNFFVHLTAALCERKVQYLMKHFASQQNKDWFTQDTFFALLRLRGVESKSPTQYAEAFYCRKLVF